MNERVLKDFFLGIDSLQKIIQFQRPLFFPRMLESILTYSLCLYHISQTNYFIVTKIISIEHTLRYFHEFLLNFKIREKLCRLKTHDCIIKIKMFYFKRFIQRSPTRYISEYMVY